MSIRRAVMVCFIAAGSLAPLIAAATNGYFTHGYGLKNKGRAGVATAFAEDAFGGANNPATMVFVGNRIDFGADLFSPRREAERFGSSPFLGPIDGSADSESNYFLIPEFGYNRMINPNLSLGVSVYGNGGMNTDYPGGQIPAASACAGFNPAPGPYNLLCGNGSLGVDYMQLFIAPTVAYKITPSHAIGVAPLIAFHRFQMQGLQAFDNPAFSTAPGFVTNRGHDTAWGYGVRVGWYGQLSDTVSLGAAYSSRVRMGEFEDYKGLFAEAGAFDIHENYNLGIAFKATPRVTLGADYQRINYSGTKTVGNPSTLLLQCFAGDRSACLGGANGAGFGWHDINVWKLAVEYQYNKELTLRGGFSHSDNPIKGQDVTFNILAPGVIENHVSLGFTYKTKTGGELTVGYTHALSNSVTAPSFFNNFTGGLPAGSETIKMYQNTIGIAYGWKM